VELSISKIQKEFVPSSDRWHGKLLPRIASWFNHILEIVYLELKETKLTKDMV